jgi:SNF2 family DNA or RNA helicase
MIDCGKLDWSKCVYPPYEHQKIGVCSLITYRYFAIFDEMGAGKTKQIIDTAGFLYEAKEIDTVLIICPAQVKDVWCHPHYSQIIEHSFVKGCIHEFTSRSKSLPSTDRGLTWVIVSVELLRNVTHVRTLQQLLSKRKYWAVDDESSTISNFRASQTRGAIAASRKACRRTILNGTPIGNTPLGLFSQMEFLDLNILGFKNYFAFRNHHAKMGGWMNKQVVGFYYLEELQTKIKPYALRRLKKDCLDLPPKIMAPIKEVRLSQSTWEKYVSMKEEFVAYLNSSQDEVSIVTSAPVKALRLAQICSGFLGGIEDEDCEEPRTAEIGCELTNAFLDNYAFRLETIEDFKLIVWCRFRPEIARLEKLVRERFPQVTVRVLQGGLSKTARDEAKILFHPDGADIKGPALLIGQPQAGRFGLNFSKCSNVDRLSSDYSLLTKAQSDDRIDRPGQKNSMLFQDYIVVGPQRQQTMSGIIWKALRQHEEMARWTCSKWIKELTQEEDIYEPF